MQEMKIIPLFSDSDALGHTNYQAIIRWMEEARSPLYRLLFSKYVDTKRFLVLAHMELNFPGETLIDRETTVQTCVSKIGRTSFTMRQELWQDENLGVQGEFVFVHFDLESRKPLPLDERMQEILKIWFDAIPSEKTG